jgi:hypothetical protein
MTSNALKQLKNDLKGLSKGLLPSVSEQQDISYDENNWKENVKGYIVLSHAAFENYLEQVAIELLGKAYAIFKNTNQPNNILVSLVLSYRIHWPSTDTACNECFWRKHIVNCLGKRKSYHKLKPNGKFFDSVIKEVIYDYFINDVIKENHGAKKEHIDTIFTPLGFNINLLDNTFQTDINSFCSIRGQLAHTTTTSGTTNILSPSNAKERVEKLLGGKKNIWGFEDFDLLIMSLL